MHAHGAVAPHRVDLARALAAGVVAALAAGDVRAARVSVGALAELVNGCAAELLGSETSDAPLVVDLELRALPSPTGEEQLARLVLAHLLVGELGASSRASPSGSPRHGYGPASRPIQAAERTG